MNIVTHGLVSLALVRGFFPRAGKLAMAGAILAGTIPDIDWLSIYYGPSAFLAWHRTYTHSILAAILISAAVAICFLLLSLRLMNASRDSKSGNGETPGISRSTAAISKLFQLFCISLCATLLHLAMDACQSEGASVLLPFSPRRFALDWLPTLDSWILALLVCAIALPELLRLVSSEIGAKTKKPRGQTGAIVGLTLLVVYIGARGTLHSSVLALMESRSFHGESARRARAFPESLSLLTWHGVAETENALNEIDVDVTSSAVFDPDSSLRLFKPEASPALNAARNSESARRILATAQIPKASVEKSETGYVIVLRDLRYAVAGETQWEVAARIELDTNNKVTSQELVWARDLPR